MSKYLLKGTDVKVFPFGHDRSNNDPYSRVLNEQNITNMIKSITDNSDYVVDYDDHTRKLQFVLNGYYFSVDVSDLLEDLPKDRVSNIYAYINMIGNTHKYLGGGDITSSTLTGSGEGPYVLKEGSYTVNLSGNQDIAYFKYTFTESGSIVFNKLTNISVRIGKNIYTDNDTSIDGAKGAEKTFELLLNEKADSGTASFNVLYPGSYFSAVKFTDDINNISDEKTHQLHVLDAEYSINKFVCVVPKASFNKFTASSIDVVNINCGTASDYSTGNT